MDDRLCRFNRRGATTHETSRYSAEHAEFERVDEDACDLADALLDRARKYGLPPDENAETRQHPRSDCPYAVPVGGRALRDRHPNAKPWLGELRVDADSAVDGVGGLWRLYFADLRRRGVPDVEIDDVLLASVREKEGGKQGEQDKHIQDAADAVMRWCRDAPRFEFRRPGGGARGHLH